MMQYPLLRMMLQIKTGDLVRFSDASNCNTIYRVLKLKAVKKPAGLPKTYHWEDKTEITLLPVFGLFKQDYKTKKIEKFRGPFPNHMILVDTLALCQAKQRFEHFITDEVKRSSGE